jgi:uncharacterized membrane protein (UPF0127 family)
LLLRDSKILHFITSIGKDIPVYIADTFNKRFWGLMGKKEGVYGLLLLKCNCIHTMFMRYDLDALYLDENDNILSIKRCIKPFSIIPPVRGAVKVLEFPSSLQALAFLTVGTQIKFY